MIDIIVSPKKMKKAILPYLINVESDPYLSTKRNKTKKKEFLIRLHKSKIMMRGL